MCGWAERGVPLTVAYRGIDRYCERYYAKGTDRRPVRIEFCEADILDLFDDWRRAVGVVQGRGPAETPEPVSRKPALTSHIERVVARLTGAVSIAARVRCGARALRCASWTDWRLMRRSRAR